jgi:hypothetical protein
MRETRTNLSPEDKAIIEQAAASALRFAYHDTVDEPLNDRIIALLKKLAVLHDGRSSAAVYLNFPQPPPNGRVCWAE